MFSQELWRPEEREFPLEEAMPTPAVGVAKENIEIWAGADTIIID